MNPSSLKRMQNLVWVLVYGGLLTIVVSLFVIRADEALACWMALAGVVITAVGVSLIFVRAKYKDVS